MLTLTPQARAVATGALGFALVAGFLTRVGALVLQFFNGIHTLDQRVFSSGVGAVTIVLGIGIFLLGNRPAVELQDGWRALAQAGQLMAVFGALIGLLTILNAATSGNGYSGMPMFG